MTRTCRYYNLDVQKNMLDGNYISAGEKLLYICSDKSKKQFKTVSNPNCICIFWASEKEVTFIEEVEENWTEEMTKKLYQEKNGTWI